MRIHQLIDKAITEEEPVCFWLSPSVYDVCAYYWLLPFFKAYPDLLHTINIIGLPFLNEKGQLFYPQNFSEVIPKEFIKTKRLLKPVTPAEYEVEGDEWMKLMNENSWVRIYEGGKKIVSKDLTWFDNFLLSSIRVDFQKANKIIHEAIKKTTQPVNPFFLEWRLRHLIASEEFILRGDTLKTIKDFEVRRLGSDAEINPEDATSDIE